MQDWQISVKPVGELLMNSVLITANGPEGAESLLVDPGAEPDKLRHMIEQAGAPLVALAATHGHFDHVAAAADLQDSWDLPLLIHPRDMPLIDSLPQVMAAYGFPPARVPQCRPTLGDDSIITLAGHDIRVRHVPGHSPGQVMFLLRGHAVVGDCLFQGSIGRTDLPGGDQAQLEKSIRERIYTLPDDTVVICGHGPDTTVGIERTTNPFVRG